MIGEGLNLLVIGMGTVFVFLALLVVCVLAMSAMVRRFAPPVVPVAQQPPVTPPRQDELVAAMTAAVHHHRQRS